MRHLLLHRHDRTKYIVLRNRLCRACWACVEVCPNGVLGKINLPFHKHAHIDNASACKGCRKCVNACMNHAIIDLKPVNVHRSQQKDANINRIQTGETK